MRSMYEEMRKKRLFYNFLFFVTVITSSIIIASVIIFFIAPLFEKDTIVPTGIFIFENDLSIKIQEEVNKAVSIHFEDIYNRLLTNIQLSIALFSVVLVIFAMVFGVIYFAKIRDAEMLIKEIQKTPGLFFKQFYREQFNRNVSYLFSQSYINRNDAINKLSFNPEIGETDYDLLQNVLLNELEYPLHVYFHQNIGTIISILIKLDNSRTIILLVKILQEQKYDYMKHNHLLIHVITDNTPETVAYIKSQLHDNVEMSTQLISLLASNGSLNDYIGYILEECHGDTLQVALNFSNTDIGHLNTTKFFVHISKREDIDIQCLHSIISHKSIKTEEKIDLVLYFYSKSQNKFDQSLNNLISMISNDESAKKYFSDIVEDVKYKEQIQKYFEKNKHQISYFENFKDASFIKQNTGGEKTKSSSIVIKEQGLHISKDGVTVVDKNGIKYEVKQYSQSVFGPMFPVQSGVMIGGIFVNIAELKML